MADIKKLVEEIKSMSVLEVSELVKELEETFGVSAAAPVAVAAPVAGAAAPAQEEKSEFTVELTEIGANKIAVIKVVREVLILLVKVWLTEASTISPKDIFLE